MVRRIHGCKTVYCCFHFKSNELLEKFRSHLVPMVRKGDIILLDHFSISPGLEEQNEKLKYLAKADVILLLLSCYFIDSDDCYALLERAVKRGEAGEALVIRIDLSVFYDPGLPLLATLRQLPLPGTIEKGATSDERFAELAKQLHQVILQEDEWV